MENNTWLGVKSSLDKEQLNNKLSVNPDLLELFLIGSDFEEYEKLERKVEELLLVNPGLKVMLHCPVLKDRKEPLTLEDQDCKEYIKSMHHISEKFENVIGFVQHPELSSSTGDKFEVIKKNLEELREELPNIDDYMYVENLIGELTLQGEDFKDFLKRLDIKNVCFDFAHFSSAQGEEDMNQMLEYLKENYNVYWHISDNHYGCGSEKPKNIGEGHIDFEKMLGYLDKGIVETVSSNEKEGKEMREDYLKLNSIRERQKILEKN